MTPAQLQQFLRITAMARGTAHQVEHTANAVVNPLEAVSDFLGKLLEPVTWIKVGEFVGGAVLVLMGIKALAASAGVNIPTGVKVGLG